MAISIAAISCVAFRWTPFTFDSVGFFGWITGILSLMVLVVTIYQVTTIKDFKKDIRNIAKEEDEIIGEKLRQEWNNFAASLTNNVAKDIKRAYLKNEETKITIASILHLYADSASKGRDMDSLVKTLNEYLSFILHTKQFEEAGSAENINRIVKQGIDNVLKNKREPDILNLKEPWRARQIYNSLGMMNDSVKIDKEAITWFFTVADKNGEIIRRFPGDRIDDHKGGADNNEDGGHDDKKSPQSPV